MKSQTSAIVSKNSASSLIYSLRRSRRMLLTGIRCRLLILPLRSFTFCRATLFIMPLQGHANTRCVQRNNNRNVAKFFRETVHAVKSARLTRNLFKDVFDLGVRGSLPNHSENSSSSPKSKKRRRLTTKGHRTFRKISAIAFGLPIECGYVRRKAGLFQRQPTHTPSGTSTPRAGYRQTV